MAPTRPASAWKRRYDIFMSNKQFIGLVLAILVALGGVARDTIVLSVYMGKEEQVLAHLNAEVGGLIERERHWKPSAGEWEEFRSDILRRLDSIEKHLQDDMATERYRARVYAGQH